MADREPRDILVVEDDQALCAVLGKRLSGSGFRIHAVSHGEAALRYATEHKPDLVILDLLLPDIDGFEVCRQLRQLHRHWSVPILMLTGLDRPSDQLRGFAHGADAYLTKPYDADELLKTVNLLLGQIALS